jgi:hypothetical protein
MGQVPRVVNQTLTRSSKPSNFSRSPAIEVLALSTGSSMELLHVSVGGLPTFLLIPLAGKQSHVPTANSLIARSIFLLQTAKLHYLGRP